MKPINYKPERSNQPIPDRCVSVQIGVKPCLMPRMRLLQLVAAILLTATLAPLCAQKPQKKEKPAPENVEWIWQYTPDATNTDGRENDLVQDLRFGPFLQQFLTSPQTFWGFPINGRYRSLSSTALDHLTVPGKVLADDQRYITITGCVVHFCPARGLLWLDLGGPKDRGDHHLVVFAAIDWVKEGKPTTDPEAEYTLYVFPDDPFTLAPGPGLHPPAALLKSIARWAAEPLAGSGIVQNITHAVLVDPDGTTHDVAPSALGIQPPPAPKSDTDTSAPTLKPRN